ncbi:anti-sigma factor [Saccharomonospora piscinae]|uniref:anti-sigma factor n=1 Tax=Saccharomonospora piscinae TaxID=687388 RepID=UPI000467095A|nr:anti-sigma factor [Saccharomonospora piscinae]
MTTPDVHTLTGAYVVNALDEFERRQFEAHMAECSQCAEEVVELREAATRLGLAAAQEPPPGLKQRVLTRITTVRQDSPGGGSSGGRGAGRWPLRLVSVAAAVAVAASVGLGVVAYRTQSELADVRQELTQVRADEAVMARLLAAPDLREVAGHGATEGRGSVMMSPSLNKGMLLVAGMPEQPSSSTYQAWAIVDGTPRSIGVLGPQGTTTTPLVIEDLSGVAEIAMTVEPEGGSTRPTTEPSVRFPM